MARKKGRRVRAYGGLRRRGRATVGTRRRGGRRVARAGASIL